MRIEPASPLWLVTFDDLPYRRIVHLSLTLAMDRVDNLIEPHLVALYGLKYAPIADRHMAF